MSIDYLIRIRSLLADLAEETIKTVSLRGHCKFSVGVRSLWGKPCVSFSSHDPAGSTTCLVSKKQLDSQTKTTGYTPLKDIIFPWNCSVLEDIIYIHLGTCGFLCILQILLKFKCLFSNMEELRSDLKVRLIFLHWCKLYGCVSYLGLLRLPKVIA